MIKKLVFINILLSVTLNAGIYYDKCLTKTGNNIDASLCLNSKLQKVKKLLNKNLDLLKHSNQGVSILSIKDINKANYIFEDYVNKQCEFHSKIWMSRGNDFKDCQIFMYTNRIKEIQYLMEGL